MTRQEKYPDTKVFHFYNANPKNRITEDCVERAISTALGQSWEKTILELAEMGTKNGYCPYGKKGIEEYLKCKGWYKQRQPKHENGTKYTGYEFCLDIQSKNPITVPKNARSKIIAMIGGGHVVAIMDGKIYDTWDSSSGCIGNFWIK